MEQKINEEIIQEIEKLNFSNIQDKSSTDLQVYFLALSARYISKIKKHTGLMYILAIINLVLIIIAFLIGMWIY